MTIYAAAVRDDEAVVWTDTESYIDAEVYSIRHDKLGIFPALQCVSFGNGRTFLGAETRHAFQKLDNFDEAFQSLPEILRNASVTLKSESRRLFIDESIESKICVAGYSPRFKQFLISEFCSTRRFEPRYCRSSSSPEMDDYEFDDDESVLRAARLQMEIFQRGYPSATGGDLVLVRMKKDAITIKKISFTKPPAEHFAQNDLAIGSPAPAVLHVQPAPVMMDYAAE